jgi:hypothetical protein
MRSLGVVLALLMVGCGDSSPTDPVLPLDIREPVTLSFGTERQLNSSLKVSFAQLVEDSRCPQSVVCVWQGNGAIRLDVTTPAGFQPVKLNTVGHEPFPNQATALGWTFTLLKLEPERKTPDPVPPLLYRATIQVTRAQG